MFVFTIPVAANFNRTDIQWKLTALRIKGQTKLSIISIFFLSVLLAGLLATLAFIISLYGLPPDIKCASGCTAFIGLGLFNVCFVMPLIGLISLISYYKANQRLKSTT